MLVKGIGNLVRVTDRDIINFDFLYLLLVLTTGYEVINSFPSPSRVSFRLNKAVMIIGSLSGFHFIIDFISQLFVISPVIRILCSYRLLFSTIPTAHTVL